MRIKLIALCAFMALLVGLAGCAGGVQSQSGGGAQPVDPDAIQLEIVNGSTTKDGVTVTLDSAQAVRKTDPDRFEYSFSGTIENNSDEGVMKVVYTFSLRDANGGEFRSFAEVFDGEDQALAPHTKIDFSHDDVKWGPQSVPASVLFELSTVETESELPAVSLPKPGQYLYEALGDEKLSNIKREPPVELSFHVDHGGYGRTAVFGEGASLDEAVDLFCNIKIGDEVDEWVTDNYNSIRLMWADGSETYISLNLRNLEYPVRSSYRMYKLENLDAFWNYAAEHLVDD